MPTLIGKTSALTRVWNVSTLSWDAWDGSLQAGSLVIGQVTANAGTNLNTSALATQATLASALTELQSILTKLNASLAVTGTFWQATQPVSGTVTANAGSGTFTVATGAGTVAVTGAFATAANQATELASLSVLDDWDETDRCKVNPIAGQAGVQGGAGGITALTQRVIDVRSVTPAQTTVSVLITNTTILASNAARLGATIYNESGDICYVKLGTTASLTSYTVQIAIGGYYEVPYGYTGNIDGITVAITAVLRVMEVT